MKQLTALAVLLLCTQATIAQAGGEHDFDFKFGTWKTHIRLLPKRLEGSKDWVELSGVVSVRKIWGGRLRRTYPVPL